MGKVVAGACMANALWLPDGLAHVCAFLPGFMKPLLPLTPPELPSAQAMGTLSGFKTEAVAQLSFPCQHSAVNNQGICAAQRRHDEVASTDLLSNTATA